MESRTEVVTVKFANDKEVQFEATAPGGMEDANLITSAFSFERVTDAIDSMIDGLKETLAKAKPTKSSVKFGLKVGLADGKLTALVVQGKSEANLEITLEWEKSD